MVSLEAAQKRRSSQVSAFALIAVVVSFLGFCVENIFLAVTLGFVDNRNLHLPFLLGYGLGVVAGYWIFGTPQKMRFFHMVIPIRNRFLRIGLYFLVMCLCVMAGEIALGTLVEKTCDIIWWEYTTLPLHITKYTSVPTTLAFGGLITLFMGCGFMPLYRHLSCVRVRWVSVAAWILLALLILDHVQMAMIMYETGDFIYVWRVDTTQTWFHQTWLKLVGGK